MSNAIYPKWKQALMTAQSNVALTGGTVRVALVDNTYTYSAAHEFFTSISSAVVGTPVDLTNRSVDDAGTFFADNATFDSVTGNEAVAVIIYVWTGTAGTSRLVAYLQEAFGEDLPVQPNGGNINSNWDATGILTL
jgi:hypothetical protein